MIEALTRYWWVPVVRGLCGIAFGLMAFANPGVAITVLVLWFGAWALVDGAFSVGGAIAGKRSNSEWVFELIGGLLGIAVGILTFRAPSLTALGLIIYIAAWSLMRGVIDIALAIRLRKEIKGEWLLVFAGISIAVAALPMWNPGPGALALLWLIASYAIVFGVLVVIFGIRVRTLRRRFAV